MPDPYTNIPGYLHATVGDTIVKPQTCGVRHHGTNTITEQDFEINRGLPAKGSDIDLIRHVEPPPQRKEESAFRGTTPFPRSPIDDRTGAIYWAGDGGFLYQIQNWKGYNISELLDGRIKNGMGMFRSPHMTAEHETAVPARVPAEFIKRIGRVSENDHGQPIVKWRDV